MAIDQEIEEEAFKWREAERKAAMAGETTEEHLARHLGQPTSPSPDKHPDLEDKACKVDPEEDKTPRAVVLHSGGIDSTTCLFLAVRDFGNRNVVALSIHYGQRHSKELEHAQEICNSIGVEHHIVEGPVLPMSMLTNPDVPVPSASYEELGPGVSPTYVPYRNGNLLSLVAAIAQAQSMSAIYFGAHAEDAHNWAYPDCTPEFIGAQANAIYIGTYHQVRLVTPLEWLTKADIVTLGTGLGVPWKLTWSCYKGEKVHCGTCPTCLARHDGFVKANITDPTVYHNTPR